MRRALAWWAARRAHRAALCPWCRQYRLPGEELARTAYGRKLVHARCLADADDDEVAAVTW